MKKNLLIGLISLVIISAILLGFKSSNKAQVADYIILYSSQLHDLEDQVETKFNSGFKCAGGVSSYKDGNNRTYFMQAMVSAN